MKGGDDWSKEERGCDVEILGNYLRGPSFRSDVICEAVLA